MSALNSWLKDVRVLDLSQYIPGPLATLLLADFGADVLKIEPPLGDEMRNLGPRDDAGHPIFYEAINAGKRVRRMDLKQAAVREEFLQLADEADVLLESFRPGVMARLGLDYATLATRNPGLVYCSLSGYGVGGPLEQAAGHDANYLAQAGVLHRNGDAAPVYFDPPIADTTGSLFAVIAIQGALRARDRNGRGCFIDMALADVAAPLQLFRVADYGARGYSPARNETYLNGGAARYRIYPTADGRHVALGALEEKFWRCFCEAAGKPEWIARMGDPMPQTTLIGDIAAYFGTLTLDTCTTRFAAPDCCVTPVLTVGEAMESGYCRQRELVRRGEPGELQALFPARVGGEAPRIRPRVREENSWISWITAQD
ncbi:MAG: CaiB/BaiF CoA transferase family protein [Burkholderiales bacterium]